MTSDLRAAVELVQLARTQGVVLWTEGGRLLYRSQAPLSAELADALKARKPSLLAYLQDPAMEALCTALPPADAWELREERAAILEFEAGFTRAEAERRAGLGQISFPGPPDGPGRGMGAPEPSTPRHS